MSPFVIVLLVVFALLVVLAVGGSIAQRRRMDRNRGAFEAQLEAVESDLARARAEDRGWERSALETAARDAYRSQRPDAGDPELTLVRVVDRPGTDEDQAVFRVGDAERGEQLTLGRRDGAWVLENLE